MISREHGEHTKKRPAITGVSTEEPRHDLEVVLDNFTSWGSEKEYGSMSPFTDHTGCVEESISSKVYITWRPQFCPHNSVNSKQEPQYGSTPQMNNLLICMGTDKLLRFRGPYDPFIKSCLGEMWLPRLGQPGLTFIRLQRLYFHSSLNDYQPSSVPLATGSGGTCSLMMGCCWSQLDVLNLW